jgi:hypothetical protein
MAGRPRTHSNILEARGAFRKDPQRRRQDAQGKAPFSAAPPVTLHPGELQAWHHIVERLPDTALANCDEIAVEICAALLTRYWATRDLDTIKELSRWLGKLGMTPQDRAKLPGQAPKKTENPFANL